MVIMGKDNVLAAVVVEKSNLWTAVEMEENTL